jgi:hypothetical protein
MAVPTPPVVSPAARLRAAWQQRETTDYRFVHPWVNVLLILVTCGIYGFYVFYQLVRRSREHNRRRLELLDAATTFAWEEANRQGVADELRPAFERVAGQLARLRHLTTEFRDPALWVLIALVANGIAQVVAFVLLDGDLVTHDRAETEIEADLATIYARLGRPLPEPDRDRVKGRDDYFGRIVAAVLTCGVYLLWWWADQQRVGDAHYAVNWPWEDALLEAVDHFQPPAS